MNKFEPYRVISSRLDEIPKEDGNLLIVVDTGEIYIDLGSERILIGMSFNENTILSGGNAPEEENITG